MSQAIESGPAVAWPEELFDHRLVSPEQISTTADAALAEADASVDAACVCRRSGWGDLRRRRGPPRSRRGRPLGSLRTERVHGPRPSGRGRPRRRARRRRADDDLAPLPAAARRRGGRRRSLRDDGGCGPARGRGAAPPRALAARPPPRRPRPEPRGARRDPGDHRAGSWPSRRPSSGTWTSGRTASTWPATTSSACPRATSPA